jgi:hypothetical protein
MKNRVSLDLDSKDVADFIAAQATQRRLLNKWYIGIDMNDVTSGNTMGTEGGWTYCKDGFDFATKFPKIYDDEELDYNEYKKDIEAATFVIDAKKDSSSIDSRLGVLLLLLGKDLMEQTHYIRARGNAKRDKNHDYVEPSNKLNTLFEKRTEKADETRKSNELIKDLKEQLAQAQKTA